MKRVLTVVTIALITAFLTGIDNTSWAGQDVQDRDAQRREAHRQALASQLQAMPLPAPIQVERTRGGKVKGVLQRVTAADITVLIVDGGTETIPLDEIKKIEKIGGRTARKVLIGVGIGVAALVGVCAASSRS
jgi:hypothetical protein